MVADSKYSSLGESQQPYVYRDLRQSGVSDQFVLLRVQGDPRSALPIVMQEVHQIDGRMPVADMMTLEDRIGVSLLLPKTAAALFGAFGVVSLLLACVGLYGVISYTVSQRTHELGIRFAVGADKRSIMLLIVREGILLTFTGVAIGVLCGLAVARVLSVILYGISPYDPATFLGVPLLLISVTVLASGIPARRAAGVHPLEALRAL